VNKKQNNRTVKPAALTLKTEAVKRLTSDMLKDVAGGMIPQTRHSECNTACIYC